MQLLNDDVSTGQVNKLEIIGKYVTFWIEDELLGVNILDVKEVSPVMTITAISHSAKEISGYVNIRGEIHLVVNLRYLFGLPYREIDNNCRIIIFKSSVSDPFGILVDKVGDVLEVNSDLIEPYKVDDPKKLNTNLITGVCKLDNHLLVILDAHRLLKTGTENTEN